MAEIVRVRVGIRIGIVEEAILSPLSEGVDCALDGGAVGARDVDRLGPFPVEGS